MFPDDYDPYMGVMVDTEEKTPDMHAKDINPTSGIYRNCYLCGYDIARLQPNQYAQVVYDRERTKQEVWDGVGQVKYVITYCASCYKSHVEPCHKANEYR